jgi:hypothetical protein
VKIEMPARATRGFRITALPRHQTVRARTGGY